MRLRNVDACRRQWVACFMYFIILATASSQNCSDESYNACTNAFISADPTNAVIPWYSAVVLLDICRRLQTFVNCMSTVYPYCSTLQQVFYVGYVDGFNYLCNSGDYTSFQQNCFSKTNVQNGAQSCQNKYNSQLSTLTNLDAQNTTAALFCTYSENYMSCIRNAILSSCSSGAATWQSTFDSKQLCPLLTGIGCSQFKTTCGKSGISTTVRPASAPSTSITTWAIILIVCIVVFLFFLIFGLVLLIICIKKKRRQAKPNPAPQSAYGDSVLFDNFGRGSRIDLPPPYPGPFNYQGLFDSPTPSAPNEAGQTSTAPVILPGGAATIDEAMGDASDVGAYATRYGDEEKVLDDGFFVPDAVEMDAKLDDAIPPPLSGNRLYRKHENKGFFPGDAHEQIGAGSISPSTSGAFGHVNNHLGMWSNLHHPRHEAPVVKSARSKSLEGQLYPTGLTESAFDRIPAARDDGPFTIDGIRDIQNFHKFRGAGSDGSDTMTSGLASMTSSSAQSASMFTRQLSNSSPMTNSMTSSNNNDNDISQSAELDYY